jgi:pyrimidine 5'-nucleotidase
MHPRFAHIRDWIFDLDNCLYPASAGLFALIDERMGAYVQRLMNCDQAEAKRIQKGHFHEHGTTLAGLMKECDIDPHDFLQDVHAIPLDRVAPDPRLATGLARLPGRKFVFTNGDAPSAFWRGSASMSISTSSTTFTPATFAPSPTRTAMLCSASVSVSNRRRPFWSRTWRKI